VNTSPPPPPPPTAAGDSIRQFAPHAERAREARDESGSASGDRTEHYGVLRVPIKPAAIKRCGT
jgi:hypothetical protein